MKKILSNGITQNPVNLQKGSVTDLAEDRSAFLRSDDPLTWSGTQLSFTSNIVLEILNTYSGTTSSHTILTANSPVSLANEESLWVQIDRTQTSENLTIFQTSITAIPAQSNSNKDIIIVAKRIDAGGLHYLHIPLHKQIFNPGDSVRLGASAPVAASSVPTGSLLDWSTETAPSGFVLTNGAEYSRTGTMAALFSVIGTRYGIGNGSTTFNVPDLRGAFVRYPDDAGTQTFDPDESSRTSRSNYVVGGTFIITGNTHNNTTIDGISPSNFANLAIGMKVTGGDITNPFTFITALVGTDTITISQPTAGTNTGETITVTKSAAGPYAGSYQGDQFKTHNHTFPASQDVAGGSLLTRVSAALTQTNTITTTSSSDGGGSETRSKNIYLYKIIKV